jgi:hypothetical protein
MSYRSMLLAIYLIAFSDELMYVRVCVYRRHHVEYPRIPYFVLSHFLMHAGINCRIFKIKNNLLSNKHLPVSEPTNCGPYGVLSSVSVAVYKQ